MKINQAGKTGAITVALALGGCGNGAQDALALKIELTALKQELEFVRSQTEDLDPRVRLAEQMAMQVFDERDAPVRLDCAHRRPRCCSRDWRRSPRSARKPSGTPADTGSA